MACAIQWFHITNDYFVHRLLAIWMIRNRCLFMENGCPASTLTNEAIGCWNVKYCNALHLSLNAETPSDRCKAEAQTERLTYRLTDWQTHRHRPTYLLILPTDYRLTTVQLTDRPTETDRYYCHFDDVTQVIAWYSEMAIFRCKGHRRRFRSQAWPAERVMVVYLYGFMSIAPSILWCHDFCHSILMVSFRAALIMQFMLFWLKINEKVNRSSSSVCLDYL